VRFIHGACSVTLLEEPVTMMPAARASEGISASPRTSCSRHPCCHAAPTRALMNPKNWPWTSATGAAASPARKTMSSGEATPLL
jgi:hypothetical protein